MLENDADVTRDDVCGQWMGWSFKACKVQCGVEMPVKVGMGYKTDA